MSENKGISRRKKTRNKLSLLVASMILLAAFGVLGTVSYLTTKTEPITNTFTASTITPGIEENFDGETKSDVKLKNLGDVDAYIRAAIVVSWVSEDGSPDALHITARKPRQIRKKATVFRLLWCRRLSGFFFLYFFAFSVYFY